MTRTWVVLLGVLVGAERDISAGELHFQDDFGPASRGELRRNPVGDPPPRGMGYKTDVPQGFALKQWIIADAEPRGPRRSFWVIPQRADGEIDTFAEQAGRSHNAIAFVGKALPADAVDYCIEFRQWIHDNDYIGFVLGASQPTVEHDGVELGYERQIPGTDQTVPDIYYRGVLGRGRIAGRAGLRRWVTQRLEVRGQHLRWRQDGEVLLAGAVATLRPGGYFGIRQRYERGTRYDDLRITVLKRAPVAVPAPGSSTHHAATVTGATWNAVDQRPALPSGWTCVALLPGETEAVPHLQWWTALPREAPARLRMTVAVTDTGTRTIDAVLAESGQSLGRFTCRDASGFQPLDMELTTAQARRAVREGIRLLLRDGTRPLWMLWRHPEPGPEERVYLPQLWQ
jgi:hypothetical protein